MERIALWAGGAVSGLLIVVGEAVLNVLVLAEEWGALSSRIPLPPLSLGVVAQGALKLFLIGFFGVWLAIRLRPYYRKPEYAALAAGLSIWFLVWAWVQWGMLLAGYVTPTIAAVTVIWGLVEWPVAVWSGVRLRHRLLVSAGLRPARA